MKFTTNGKQVLKDGEHYGEGASSEAAQEIVDAMNIPDWLDSEAERLGKSKSTARTLRITADSLRAKFHRMED